MKKTRIIVLVYTLLILLVGCSKMTDLKKTTTEPEKIATASTAPEQKEKETGILITDMEDRTVLFEQVPDKMVVLLASDVETLYELGAGDRIVAVGEFCNYPEDALGKDKIATGDELNVEEVIAHEPDVVVIGSMGQTKEQVEQLETAGIQVVVTNSKNIEETYIAIELMGTLSGKEKEAENLIHEMKAEFTAIQEKADGNKKKSVYFEISPLEYGLWTAGSGTFMQELADIIGVKNAFGDVNGWAEISEEQVLERNPDYIVTSTMYDGQGKSPIDEILGRQNWKELNAVKNQAVFNGDSDMMTRPGPRLVDAAKELYKFVYGE